MNICTVAKLIWCLVYYRNHKLCILMSLSILFDNYSHHIIDIHHLHGLLHCGFLNFVLMWLHIHTGNRNIFYLHWSLICGTWNQLYLWFFYHTGCTSLWVFKLVCVLTCWWHWQQESCQPSWTTFECFESFSLRPICFRRRNCDYTQQLCEHRHHIQEYH